SGTERRFPVLARHFDVRRPVRPRPVRTLPAEQRPNDVVSLPSLKAQRLPSHPPLDVRKHLEELTGRVCSPIVEMMPQCHARNFPIDSFSASFRSTCRRVLADGVRPNSCSSLSN